MTSSRQSPSAVPGIRRIAQLLDQIRPQRRSRVDHVVRALQQMLRDASIDAELSARLKEPDSVRLKMLRKGTGIGAIHDVCGVRVLVDDDETCYAVLDLIHERWPHIPEELDDYIRHPKANGYRSLHTTVILSNGRTVEVQIRTHAHHRDAEFGEASHRRYKWESLQEVLRKTR